MKHYANLKQLLENDPEARALFVSLPGYVQTSINDRPGHINSLASLRTYANNMLQGDD